MANHPAAGTTAVPVPASASPSSTPNAGPAPATAPSPSAAGSACGELDCRAFDTPRQAFEQALTSAPRVIAIGEAHAQKAAPGVESATSRFARELLPALAPRTKGIVIELLAPDRRCEQHEEQAVAERTKPVTEPQRETNQSEFVALGFAAKKLGIRAEPLVPTCDELKTVLHADNDVGALLELIANITVRETFEFLDHQKPEAAIAIYGGLLHNDVTPKPGQEAWSFGPRIRDHARGSYVEVDLIVPELIRSEPPWTELPWFSHYDPTSASNQTLLYRTGPASFVLIFPRSDATANPKATP
ncbi:MAG TPA: hypothetical protein VLJ38_08590 [Polyangiaceae bacterium]|nr:hypothetical protein [Polyangiaceae bacterium]